MEIRNVLERLKLLTNDNRENLLLMLSGDAVQRLKARLCCTEEEENAHEEALCAAAAAQAAYQFWLLEEAASPKSLTAGEVRAEFEKNQFFPSSAEISAHLLPKFTDSGSAIPLTIAFAEDSFEV